MKGRFRLRAARLAKPSKGKKKRRKGPRQVLRRPAPIQSGAPSPESGRTIIARLPEMRFDELMRSWRNTIRILSNSEKPAWHDAALALREAIGKEWNRRAKLPINPDDFFKWPSTEAPGGTGRIDLNGLIEQGLFSYMEYRVGRTNGLEPAVRKLLLAGIFVGPLPPVFPPNYMAQWSVPKSARRLQKMAETLAAFVRNAKRRHDDRLDDAISEWEHDLQFLYERYYLGHFHFSWPTTKV